MQIERGNAADAAGALALHDDHDAPAGIADRIADREHAMQIDQRQILAAQRQDMAAADHGMNVGGERTQILDDRNQRNDERLAPDRHHHAVDHRQGERQRQRE